MLFHIRSANDAIHLILRVTYNVTWYTVIGRTTTDINYMRRRTGRWRAECLNIILTFSISTVYNVLQRVRYTSYYNASTSYTVSDKFNWPGFHGELRFT